MPLPDFLVIGAPKAGTTALHAALARHPGLHLSPIKEPKFFLCDENRPPRDGHRGPGDAHSAREWIWRRDRYERLFAAAPPGTRRGESTPFYLWDRAAHRRIRRLVPEARLIAVVRDPVDRAHSNWTHLRADGLEPISDFLDACAAEPGRVARGWAPFWRYQELGRYGEQLAHLYEVFPAEQVHVLRYRDLVDDPRATLDEICAFLGVGTGLLGPAPAENVSLYPADTPVERSLRLAIRAGAVAGSAFPPKVWRQASRPLLRALKRKAVGRPELTAEERAALTPAFAADVALLEEVTGRDFGDWLTDRPDGSYTARRAMTGPSAAAS